MPNEISNQTPTMSSREIAELVESRHDSVKRTIERLAGKALIGFTPSVETSHEGAGARDVEVYLVGKRDSYVVVAQLCPEFTARLVDRWQELESAAASIVPALPRSYAEALRELASSVERAEQQQVVIDALKPKADFHDAVTDAVNCQDMQAVAKVIGTGRNRLFSFLRDKRRKVLQDNNRPYQRYEDAGYFRVVEHVWHDGAGKPHIGTTTYVTGKGVAFIQKLWAAANDAEAA